MPTRSAGGKRNSAALEAYQSWLKFSEGNSHFIYGVDEDDHQNYDIPIGVDKYIMPRMRFVPKLNYMAKIAIEKGFNAIYFIGDDHRFRTSWESRWIEDLGKMGGVGVLYGNDLLQGKNLPTSVLMTSNIISAMGWMTPPVLQHMYADNFWKDIGTSLGVLRYYDDVIVEHMHFSIGKTKADSQYFEVAKLHAADKQSYDNFIKTEFSMTVEKVRRSCGLVSLEQDFTD